MAVAREEVRSTVCTKWLNILELRQDGVELRSKAEGHVEAGLHSPLHERRMAQ